MQNSYKQFLALNQLGCENVGNKSGICLAYVPYIFKKEKQPLVSREGPRPPIDTSMSQTTIPQ